ncbi:MAG: hypothetical protein ABL900_07185, partial [Burkholderiaceae bacterium]
GSQAGSSARFEVAVQGARAANAMLACGRLAELRMRLDAASATSEAAADKARARIYRMVTDWGVNANATASECTTALRTRSTLEIRTVAAQAEAAYAYSFSIKRLAPLAWTSEPAADDIPVVTAKALGLRAYFVQAFKSPRQHLASVTGDLDLPTSWLLLTELIVMLLAVLDACLRRANRGQTGASQGVTLQ